MRACVCVAGADGFETGDIRVVWRRESDLYRRFTITIRRGYAAGGVPTRHCRLRHSAGDFPDRISVDVQCAALLIMNASDARDAASKQTVFETSRGERDVIRVQMGGGVLPDRLSREKISSAGLRTRFGLGDAARGLFFPR